MTAVRSTQVGEAGHPRFAQTGFGADANPLGLREPRVYFGEQPAARPPYVVVASRRAEVDEPAPGSEAPDYHYDGPGGIGLSGLARRSAFALRFGDLNLLLSQTITGRSRILLHRDARERLRTLAPFLRWDGHPHTVVAGGHVNFLFSGYTTSRSYPYSQPVELGGARVNYARAAVHAVVDGFTGSVRIYAADAGDPILRAWRTVYPGLVRPAAEMPAGLRSHLRYPVALFDAQIEAYATHHAAETTAFANGSDTWERAVQLAGPVEKVGEIRFPTRSRATAPAPPPSSHGSPARAASTSCSRCPSRRAAARTSSPTWPPSIDERRPPAAHPPQPPPQPPDARAVADHAPDPGQPGGEPPARALQPRGPRPRRRPRSTARSSARRGCCRSATRSSRCSRSTWWRAAAACRGCSSWPRSPTAAWATGPTPRRPCGARCDRGARTPRR